MRFQYRLAWQMGLDPDVIGQWPEAKFRRMFAWWIVENEPAQDAEE